MSASHPAQRFGFTMAAAFAVLGAIRFLWSGTIAWWLALLALAFLLAAWLVPSWLHPLEKGWMKFAEVLGFINSRILLSILFFLIVTPIGLMLRLLGKQPITLSRKRDEASYWVPRRPEEFGPERLERQF